MLESSKNKKRQLISRGPAIKPVSQRRGRPIKKYRTITGLHTEEEILGCVHNEGAIPNRVVGTG